MIGKNGSFTVEFIAKNMEDPRLISRCFEEFAPAIGVFSESVASIDISIPKRQPGSGSFEDLKSELVRIFKADHANKGFWTIQDVWMYSDDVLRRRHLIAGTLFEDEKMALTVWSGQVMGKRTEVFRDYGRKGGRLGIRVWASGPEFEAVKAHTEGVLGIQFENKR